MPKDKQLYLPILVGASQNWREGIKYQRDDSGNNISKRNPFYSELTAVYWAWKNLDNVDAVGLVHYRRYFLKRIGKRTIKNVIDRDEVEDLLRHVDILLPQKRKYYIETNYTHYIHAHHSYPLNKTRAIISKFYPSYLKSFDIVMNRRSAHMFNMFIMKKELFDNYCEWLFQVLNQVGSQIKIQDYSTQEKRVFGYIGELLLNVWIDKNGYKFKEIRWGILGKKHTFIKMISMITRKLGKRTKTHF